MKTTANLLVLLAMLSIPVFAAQVDVNTAKQVGQNFLATHSTSQVIKGGTTMSLVYTAGSKAVNAASSTQPTNYFYVFNAGEEGFVVVSADDVVVPVLAYSDKGTFDPANIPPNAAKWLEGYKTQIRDAIRQGIQATGETASEWQTYKSGIAAKSPAGEAIGVNPLLKTKWDQAPYYNDLCPGGSVTGCVATAMAQVMKFWNYPPNGTGFYSYNHDTYGTLSANFGSTTYRWNQMPNVVSGSNSAVATLMVHCGVSVEMNYGTESSGAAGAVMVAPALKEFFGYPATVEVKERRYYSTTQWKNLLKQELDAGRPMYYEGTGSGSGHAFVCDGYDNNDFFHFNWGWGGLADGYFSITRLNPTYLGTGSGLGSYNSNQKIVLGIKPPERDETYSLVMYDHVTASSNPLQYGKEFSVSTNIANFGTGTYTGDYAAAIFDDEYNFVDFVEIRTGYTLQAGYTYTSNLVFSNKGISGMFPGTYYIGIFYRPAGGKWVIVPEGKDYSNIIEIRVIYPNDIEMNSSVVTTPAKGFVQGEPGSVNFNVVNRGDSTFYGQYLVAIYDLEGDHVQTINSYSENRGLPPNYYYLPPYITLSTNAIDADPGTYYIAVLFRPQGTSGWQMAGSTNYHNPAKVTVQAPPVKPDKYEPNNTLAQASVMPLAFTGNLAKTGTSGSNFHVGSDYDCYKINLPPGYAYSIRPRLHDSYDSADGNTYTVDGLFSWSKDGENWSDAYDDVIDQDIEATGGSALWFLVAPYFSGETGTYLLEISITRSTATSVTENDPGSSIIVYPNPTGGQITIDLQNFTGNIQQVRIFDQRGQAVEKFDHGWQQGQMQLSLANHPTGIYFIQIESTAGVITKKIVFTP